MLWSLSVLILSQLLGDLLHSAIGLHVPGTVIGICLLLAGLCIYARATGAPPSLPAADALLPYLALFFVAPGVNALMQAGQLARAWPAVLAGLLGSTALALALTGRLAQALLAWQDRRTAAAEAASTLSQTPAEIAP